jgi:phage tail protein X
VSGYSTTQGDTWDVIAKKVYGNEKLADLLMAGNFELLDTLVFSAGVTVRVPEKPAVADTDLPPWRRTGV